MKFGVAYVNWLGVWTQCEEVFDSHADANTFKNKIARTKALNGRAAVFQF